MVLTSRSGTAARPGFIYKPISNVFYPAWKILVYANDSTVYKLADFTTGDVSDNYLIDAIVTRPHTDRQASAVVTISNTIDDVTLKGKFTNVFFGGEVIEIYADYNDASTLLYRGRIIDPKHSLTSGAGYRLVLDSRDYPELTDDTMTGRVVSSRIDTALCSVLDDFNLSDIFLQYWNGYEWANASYNPNTRAVTWDDDIDGLPNTILTYSWQEKKPWSIIQELCGRAGVEFYLEYDKPAEKWRLRIFVPSSKQNNNFSVAIGQNLLSLTNFGPENSTIFNQVRVYGKQESSNIIMVTTKEDVQSQQDLWKKVFVVNDPNLLSNEEVIEKADYELRRNLVSAHSGRITTVGDASIRPGEQIGVGIPHLEISGYHTISEIKQQINNNGFTTNIEITKQPKRVATLFREKTDIEREAEVAVNLNNMRDSINVFFDENPSRMSLAGCEETQGRLVLSVGQTTGVATSEIVNMSYNVEFCEFRKFSNFPFDENDVYEVTSDGGVTWETYDITSGLIHQFSTPGSRVAFRITLNRDSVSDTSPAYESVVLLLT